MKRKFKFSKIFLRLLIFVFFIVVIFIFSFEAKYKDRFYPGVFVDGKSVGGKTYSEVLEQYKIGADALSKNGITLILEGKDGDNTVNIPMTASGMSSDKVVEYFSLGKWEDVLNNSYKFGRNESQIKKIKERLYLLFKNKIFDFPSVFQNEAVRSFYERELQEYLNKPIPAEFFYKNGTVAISQEKEGESINFNEITEEIRNKLSSFDPSPIKLKAEKTHDITTLEKLTPYLPIAKEIAKTINLSFKYQNYEINVTGKKFITWLSINEENRLAINENKIKSFLYKNILPVLDNPAQNSRFGMKDGVLVETVSGTSGNIVDVKKTIAKTEELIFGIKKSFSLFDSSMASIGSIIDDITIKNGVIVIPIVITESEPQVTKDTISDYKIKELVGTAITSFKGSSADRIHNIKIGVSKLSGILIAPGEEFSTVTSIGATTEEEGFVKEFVIKENKSVKELGGGLCQVATTLFRLALNAGLPIKERTNHRYVVSYYGPGLDATIYDPHPDLRFANDTNHYLLLQGEVKGNELIFELYGQKDGRKINISEPIFSNEKPAPETKYLMSEEVKYATMECSETPRKGLTTEVTYNVQYKNGQVNEQKFKSVYQPWGKICLIGLKK